MDAKLRHNEADHCDADHCDAEHCAVAGRVT
jgi:hypothetical protein